MEDSGIKLGRDVYMNMRRELAGSRCFRMDSEILGPLPDEHNGQREKWLAKCRTLNVK
jgi:hypothetical protein